MTTALSKQQKLELIAALEEKARRKAVAKPIYVPHKSQLEIHQSRALNRFVFSGNGFGKSTVLVNELKWLLEGYNPITQETYPYGLQAIVVLDSSLKIDDVILPALRKWMDVPEEWLKRGATKYISRIDNGRTSIRLATVQTDPMSLEGTTLHRVYIDEPLPRHLYVALKRSLRDKRIPGKLMFCGTPISQPWLMTDIYEPWSKGELPDTECFRGSTMENIENLDKEGIESFSRSLSEAERATRLEGQFFTHEAMALAHLWRRDHHILHSQGYQWDPTWPCVVGLDPHYSKPHVAVMVGANPKNELIVLKELSLKLTAREFAHELWEWMRNYKVVDIVCDSLGQTDGTGNEGFASFIQVVNSELRNYGGPGVRATTFEEKSHEAAIDRLQTNLAIPSETPHVAKLRVDQQCKGVISNIETVGWLKERHTGTIKPKLDTAAKDFLSALCYALAANVHFNKGKERPIYRPEPLYKGLPLRSHRRNARFWGYR